MGIYAPDLTTLLGRLNMNNPVMTASGTFGYGQEMAPYMDLGALGAIVCKTVTRHPRAGNAPPRTCETAAGMLNAIGLQNVGIENFITHKLPPLQDLAVPIIVNIAGESVEDFAYLIRALDGQKGVAGFELNISCPNVAHGLDFATNPELTEEVVAHARAATALPLLAKLSPNVTDITVIARAAEAGGADALTLVNTFVGMAIDWRRKKPILGNIIGGLSGPAIKPLALRCVWQIAKLQAIPIIGVGGIASIDDVMEFLLAGASAVQVGTASFYDPTASVRIVDALPAAIESLGATSVRDVVGTLSP